jgi:hypothetical protein
MATTIKQRVKIKETGVIEVRSDKLRAGAEAEVIVLLDDAPSADVPVAPTRTLSSFIGAGKGLFGSSEEVDRHIRGLREEWES